jgi:hypothetical protein
MDDRTRAATYQDVQRVAELLDAEGVEYAPIGGYALALQGIVRLTEDVDILVEPTLENTRRWVRALSRLPDGAAKELAGDDSLHEELYAIRVNDEFTVDVMNSASGFTWADLARFRTRVDGIPVLSLEGLLLMKERGRLKDQADAEAIRLVLGRPAAPTP